MEIGVPKEIKPQEARVGLTPAGVRELVARGHVVQVESGAGIGAGLLDEDYVHAGARIAESPEAVFASADIVVKVKEPQPSEYDLLRHGQILYTYLHLAPDPKLTQALQASGCTAIAYETITDHSGALPLLAPMSEVAGRLSVQAGAACLERINGGSGTLLGGVPGVQSASTVIIGGGVVGTNAMQMAIGLNAHVTLLGKSLTRLREIDAHYGGRVQTLYSNVENLEASVRDADLVIGAVLIPGASAPRLVSRRMIQAMRPGSAVVDVAIDQGGCFETSHATTHADPRFRVDGVVHYCVSNMPGAVPRTATHALTNATLPYLLRLADLGFRDAMRGDSNLANGLNIHAGEITHPEVARSMVADHHPVKEAIGA